MRRTPQTLIVAAAGLVLLLVFGAGRLGAAVAAVRWSEQTVLVHRCSPLRVVVVRVR